MDVYLETLDREASRRVADLLTKRRDELLDRWTTAQLKSDDVRNAVMSADDVRRQSSLLLGQFLSAVDTCGFGDFAHPGFAELRATLGELSASRAVDGFTPTETATSVFALREALLSILTESGSDDLLPATIAVSRLVDKLGMLTFSTFVRSRESVIAAQAEQLLEISTPVVQLWDGIVALPLIGTLDSARTQVVMENLLQTIVDTGASVAILDITGVPAVDTLVAQHLMKTVEAARLMGAHVIVSGIRPHIAQTIVTLGIDFGDLVTRSTMADALALAFAYRKRS